MFRFDLEDGAELRILERRHAEELLEFVSANREYLGEWLDWARTMATVDDARRFLERGVDRYASDGLPLIGIWLDGRMAGGILFFPLNRHARSTEVGYWLGPHAAGRGIMTRALAAVLDHVFGEMGLNRVGLQAAVDNERSRAVAERLGFTFEGVLRQSWPRGEGYTDNAVYSMLAGE
jgi:ribosomal-protein-serine acetyltransferase